MDPITTIRSRTVVIANNDIDTDQIIPARFLTTTTRTGLGAHLFNDWRFDDAGQPRSDFVLNDVAAKDCQVLVAGNNFGCGSSREHAPWALADFGFRAVVSGRIADIFRSNALKNGLVPVVVDDATHRWLLEHPGAEVVIDLEPLTLTLPDGTSVKFALDEFARHCLMQGVDELGYLLSHEADIARYEENLR